MHMLSRKDLNSAEMETVRVSKNPLAVIIADGEVHTKEEATVYVKVLDLFVTVMLLDDTPAVLSRGNLCEDHRYSCEWTSGQLPHYKKKKQKRYNATRKITCRPLSQVCLRALPVRPQVLLQHRYRQTHQVLHQVQQAHDVRVRVIKHWETKIKFYIKSSKHTMLEYEWSSTGRPVAGTIKNLKQKIKMATSIKHKKTCCAICPSGWKNSQRTSWSNCSVSKYTPASSSRESDPEPPRKVVSAEHSIKTQFRRTENAKYAGEPQLRGFLQGTH